MGALEHGPRDQGGLHSTALALKGLTSPLTQDIMTRFTTVGAAKPFRPAGAFQRGFTLGFSAEPLKKRRQRQARLKLDPIHRHGPTPVEWFASLLLICRTKQGRLKNLANQVIKNGMLLICELKSSIDKAGMYIFERKARFYERRHGRQANRLLVISPMIDARARQVAKRLGIETYGDSTEVELV